MPVNNPFALVAGQQYADGTASSATNFTGTVAMSFNGTSIVGLRSDTNDNLLVTGTLTHNNAAPIADNFGVLPAVASSAAPTYNAGDQVLLSTDLAGNLRVNATFTGTATNNITQWASTTLGAPSNYGTSPGAVIVPGVNAFVTNTVTVTGTVTANQGTSPWVVSLASTTITGTVAVTQSTSPWVVAGALTNNNAAPTATLIGVMSHIAETAYTTVTYTTGDVVLATTDLHGATNVDMQAYAGTQLTGTVTAYGTAPTGNVFGVNAFITNTVPVTLTSTTITGTVAVTQSTSPWVVSLTSTTITGTVAVTQSTSPWTVQGDSASGAAKAGNPVQTGAVFNTTQPTVTTGQTVENQATARGAQIVATGVDTFNVTVNAALPAGANVIGAVTQSGGPWTVSGTVAVTQSTSPWVVSLASTTITGTVAVTQSTSPWVVSGGLTHNAAAPAANNVGALVAVASTAAPTYSTGDQVLLSTDLAGNLRVSITGSVVASNNITEWNSVALGSPSAYGTSPGAVNVIGVNAFITNTVTVSGTVTANQGTANATPWNENIAQVGGVTVAATAKGTQGTNAFPVQDLKDAGRTPVVLFMDAIAAITTEALATMSINKGGTVTSATQYTVTAGKTLRIQTISVSIQETNSTVQWTKFRFRSAATVTATSPLFAGTQTGTSGATGSVGQATVPVPDGLEIAAGQQVGVSHIESATNATVTYCIVGYEY